MPEENFLIFQSFKGTLVEMIPQRIKVKAKVKRILLCEVPVIKRVTSWKQMSNHNKTLTNLNKRKFFAEQRENKFKPNFILLQKKLHS